MIEAAPTSSLKFRPYIQLLIWHLYLGVCSYLKCNLARHELMIPHLPPLVVPPARSPAQYPSFHFQARTLESFLTSRSFLFHFSLSAHPFSFTLQIFPKSSPSHQLHSYHPPRSHQHGSLGLVHLPSGWFPCLHPSLPVGST